MRRKRPSHIGPSVEDGDLALRISPGQDGFIGVLAALGLALSAVAIASAPTPDQTAVMALLVSLVCGSILAGWLWRRLDKRPAVLADKDGLRFHPSLCHRRVAWHELRRIRIVSGGRPFASGELQFDLTFRPFGPSTLPLRRTVSVRLASLGRMTWAEAKATRKHILALRRAATGKSR